MEQLAAEAAAFSRDALATLQKVAHCLSRTSHNTAAALPTLPLTSASTALFRQDTTFVLCFHCLFFA